MRSVNRIEFTSHTARNVADAGGLRSRLTVEFRVFDRGTAHVAGRIATADFWQTTAEVRGAFKRFEGAAEVWRAERVVPGNGAAFEYVLFCDDFRGVGLVPRVWNTNGGQTLKATAAGF